ncbi:hypothetical protein A33Q_3225 [Indibacter alkaliphilus LW1]|uniref:Benzil reductase ((S)-benzoin forming) n=1 Tax=Indibacter alkaliphilus (strain CCUG 57479 / KCTC 22604 / LW1) TaxID=1189612 RepID=S2E198_INDAL|nr:SDR family NAD(P)-dependent oxidoreductase [Indibacter alkaliphilus]EOZ95863.1 hypothetical protein A33Q_3225 [Indibacter alkaliphilus LW1]
MKSLYIITGSSKGIGKALVDALLEDPVNEVIGIARSEQVLDKGNFTPLNFDLSDFDLLDENLFRIFPEAEYSKIVLINNAGWIGPIRHVGKLKLEEIKMLFDLNVVVPMFLMDAFVKYYASANAEKTVVNISSGAAKKAIDGWAGYSSSKAALNMMTEAAQVEADLDGTGIRYFAVAPGVVDTDMQGDIRGASEKEFSKLDKFEKLKSDNQLSSPQEAAEKIIFLINHRDKFEGVLQDVREF